MNTEKMNNRTQKLAILNYVTIGRLPLIHFSYWTKTLLKWAAEGHIVLEVAKRHVDNNTIEVEPNKVLGWDLGLVRSMFRS